MPEIVRRHVIFYDNNLIANPHIEKILSELASHRVNGKPLVCECQSGLDGRILMKKPWLAAMLKQAGFRLPRIAWDGPLNQAESIQKQLAILETAGFPQRDLYIFMLYNWKVSFEEMERKRKACWEWGVQISDCRFRPLDRADDLKQQTAPSRGPDYVHSPVWSLEQVLQFRRNVREHNIGIRFGAPYSHARELAGRARRKDQLKTMASA